MNTLPQQQRTDGYCDAVETLLRVVGVRLDNSPGWCSTPSSSTMLVETFRRPTSRQDAHRASGAVTVHDERRPHHRVPHTTSRASLGYRWQPSQRLDLKIGNAWPALKRQLSALGIDHNG
jgi:hypothetical protein